jgi:calpain-15
VGVETGFIPKKWKRVAWLAFNEIYSFDKIFPATPSPSHTVFGSLSNHYFVSALAALAEKPALVEELFLSSNTNEAGVFGIQLCLDGEWKEVVVDSLIPCDKDKLEPCFTHVDPWVTLLEKAYAKSIGSYSLIEKGSVEILFQELTGAPSIGYDSSLEGLWNVLKEAYNNNWIVTASASDTYASKELLQEIGLSPFLHYAIFNLNEVQYEDNNINEFLLRMRNPWGKIEWIGEWSFLSSLWSKNLKKMLNYEDITDNSFFMSLKDFKHYFARVQICKVNPLYSYNSFKIRKQSKQGFTLLYVDFYDNSHCYFQVTQKDKRQFINTEYGYSLVRMIISKIDKERPEELRYIIGKMGQEKSIFEEKELEAGSYLVYLEINYESKEYPFVFGTYSKMSVKITEAPANAYINILDKIYMSCAKIQKNILKFGNEVAPKCLKYANVVNEGFAYIYFENDEEDSTYIENITYTTFEGLKLLPPYSGTSYYVEVAPGEKKIILIKQLSLKGFNLIYSYKFNL